VVKKERRSITRGRKMREKAGLKGKKRMNKKRNDNLRTMGEGATGNKKE
jgi:hypothetical protein